MDIISRENKQIFLMGDYNIDLLKVNQNCTSKILNILSCYAFHPHIDNPTRISCRPTSETLLDNIFSNSSVYPFINGIFYIMIFQIIYRSLLFVINRSIFIRNGQIHIYKRKEIKNNIILFNQDLQNEFWEDVYNEYDAHKAYDIYIFFR